LREDDSGIGGREGEEGEWERKRVARGLSGGWGERKFTEAICC